MSWSEYLVLEGMADESERIDYAHGVVLAQVAPSQDHETIVANLTLLLGPAIRAHGCRFSMKQTVCRIGASSHDPDFLVSCDPSDLGPGEHRKRGLIEHPALIVEVLSPSTRSFDFDDNGTNYGTYPSLLHDIIIDTLRQRVTHFHRAAAEDYGGTYVPELTSVTENT